MQQVSPPVPRQFDWLCASVATSKDRTSPSSTDMRRERLDRFPELAAELVRLKVDIIVVAGGTRLIRAAKNATKTIPIVMIGGGFDPVEAGLVESLAHPGGNVTGITNLSTELGGKRLELLKEAVPKACPCRGSLRFGQSGQCTRSERGSSSRGACAEVDYSNLGGTRLWTISIEYSLRSGSGARMDSMCPAGAR